MREFDDLIVQLRGEPRPLHPGLIGDALALDARLRDALYSPRLAATLRLEVPELRVGLLSNAGARRRVAPRELACALVDAELDRLAVTTPRRRFPVVDADELRRRAQQLEVVRSTWRAEFIDTWRHSPLFWRQHPETEPLAPSVRPPGCPARAGPAGP
ncbi:MAG: hypothetical protein R2939_04510 [Kofleriaceae bacterium]